jgi:hypothetical protein
LFLRAQQALGLTQERFGDLIGVSRRTLIRWGGHAPYLGEETLRRLVGALYPVDPDLAVQLAKQRGTTLELLGVVVPPPPVASSPAPVTTAPRELPRIEHLIDSMVCAAAEAMSVKPPEVRPVVIAAFERARALHLDVEEICESFHPREAEPPKTTKAKTKRGADTAE